MDVWEMFGLSEAIRCVCVCTFIAANCYQLNGAYALLTEQTEWKVKTICL